MIIFSLLKINDKKIITYDGIFGVFWVFLQRFFPVFSRLCKFTLPEKAEPEPVKAEVEPEKAEVEPVKVPDEEEKKAEA